MKTWPLLSSAKIWSIFLIVCLCLQVSSCSSPFGPFGLFWPFLGETASKMNTAKGKMGKIDVFFWIRMLWKVRWYDKKEIMDIFENMRRQRINKKTMKYNDHFKRIIQIFQFQDFRKMAIYHMTWAIDGSRVFSLGPDPRNPIPPRGPVGNEN